MLNFSASFDPQSLSEIARFVGFKNYLSSEVQTAMSQGGDILVSAAVANTWAAFKNPTGTLAGTIGKVMNSPYEIQIGAGTSYSHRREFSFKGPDSLGRMFPNDPAAYFFTNALRDHSQDVLMLVEGAALKAFERIGTG